MMMFRASKLKLREVQQSCDRSGLSVWCSKSSCGKLTEVQAWCVLEQVKLRLKVREVEASSLKLRSR